MSGNTYTAVSHKLTAEFLSEYFALCIKHRMALVPTFGSYLSFHDCLRVVPWTEEVKRFTYQTDVDPSDFGSSYGNQNHQGGG
jgi:hypothetical protein